MLQAQLAQAGVPAGALSEPPWDALLQAVHRSYTGFGAPAAELLEREVQERTAALHLSEGRLRSLLSLSVDWVWEQDEQGRIAFLSERLRAATGLDPAPLMGRRLDEFPGFAAAEVERQAYQACVDARLPFRDFNFRIQLPGVGQPLQVRGSGEPVFAPDGAFRGYRGVARDVSAEMAAVQEAQRLARYDGLTGLPNRNQFLHELRQAMARARRSGQPFAVGFVDLDRFKTVNDTLGHGAGDELLREMAQRLRRCVREVDTVGRLGGDEFVLLFEACGERDRLTQRVQTLLDALAEPVRIQERDFLVTGSIGLACYPADGDDVDTLLTHADAAMYLAKERGKNNLQFYDASLARQAERQFEIESTLRMGLARNELLLHYQPKVCARSGRMLGMEALLRWQRPGHGLVPPAEFIPLAEERGLIVPMGRWVLRQACNQVRLWRAAGLEVPPVSVNLSAHQFADPSLLLDLEQALQQAALPAGQLEVELTESALMAEPERAKQLMRRMRDMGVHIAIDDFGTGYSSLSYLKRFPAGTLKIDRSFVRGLPGDGDDAAIASAVIAMAHSLGLSVVAEGVETERQLEALRRLGCDQVQGYLTGRPMCAEAMAECLRDARRVQAVALPD